MFTRRMICAGLLAAPAAHAAPATLLDRAIRRAGGERALSRAHVLRWTGTAKIVAGSQVIEIGASTEVNPFRSARSETWLLSEGPSKPRSLIVDGPQGWTERNGERRPLPPAQSRHEVLQYGLYGVMLLTPLRDPGASFRIDETRREISAEHPGAPPTVLLFGPDDRLVGARNTVPSPEENGAPIQQAIRFEGQVAGGGVRWPRKLTIDQDDKPYFELTLETFSAGL